jgi:hypothetical protein
MTLTSNYNDPPSLLVHASQQKKGKEPVAKIVRSKSSVESIIRPRLFTEVLEAGVENEGTNGWNLANGDPSLWRGLLISGNFDQYLGY